MIDQIFDGYHLNNFTVKDLHAVAFLHKVSEGSNFVDDKYEARLADAQAAGVLWAATHLGTGDDVQAQLNNMISHAHFNGQIIGCLDFEKTANRMTLFQGGEFVELFHSLTNQWPLLYCSATTLGAAWVEAVKTSGEDMANQALLSMMKCDLWVSDDKTPPVIPDQWGSGTVLGLKGNGKGWKLNQYKQDEINGVLLDVDRAQFDTIEQLRDWWISISPAAYVPVVEQPTPVTPPVDNGVNGMKDSQGNIFWPYASGLYKTNLPPLPTPEQVWQSETQAESFRKSIPPATLATLSMLDAQGRPHDFAVYAGDISLIAGIEPAPILVMRVEQTINVHSGSSLASGHVLPALKIGDRVNIIAGTETPEPATGTPRYIWVALADRPGQWACMKETVNGVTTTYLIPA